MVDGACPRAAWLALCLATACAAAGPASAPTPAGDAAVDRGAGGSAGVGGGAGAGGRGGAGGGTGAGGTSPADARPGDDARVDAGADGAASPALPIVTRQGTRFMEAGSRHTFVGANFWQAMNLGAAGAGGDRARLQRELDRLQALGVTNLRVMAASEGPDTEPYRMVPSLMPQAGVYNEDVFRGLDFFLDQIARRGMRAVMVLNNYWEWSGGMGQYVSWGQGTRIPYRLDVGGTYERFTQYVDRFYACAPCQDAFRAHIRAVVGRVNSVNGRAYRDDGAIFSWELANEPRDYPSTWIGDVAAFIKSLDARHMVTTGSEGSWAADFRAAHASASIDYATCHIWVEPWGMYDPVDRNAANLTTATSFALTYLTDHDTMARALGKPLVLEEFGLARDGWTAGGKTDPAATLTNRNRYYQSLFGAVEASLAAAQGTLAGDGFWAWAGEARPPNKWVGDPPHEPAGWFSVYDADTSTTQIIAAHAAVVRQAAGR